MCYFNAVKLLRHTCHGALENNRLADSVTEYHTVTVLDDRDSLFRRHGMFFIVICPFHNRFSSCVSVVCQYTGTYCSGRYPSR